MLGQEKLIEKINNSNLDNFPQSLLLIGEKGCGKHTLLNYISTHLKLELKELNSKINDEDIEIIISKPYPIIYFINMEGVFPKFQNTILKLIEEPPIGKYFILLSTSEYEVLPTIKNRCRRWIFNPYKKDILSTFINNVQDKDLILNIATTPGQVITIQNHPLKEMADLANNILNRLHLSSLPNVLSISDRIGFNNEKGKFDLDIFLKVLTYCLLDKVIHSTDNKNYSVMVEELILIKTKLKNTISIQKTFENFLIRFWEASKL